MKLEELNIAETGDVHTGHPSTPTRHICTNIRAEFNEETLKGVHWLIIAGDWTDRLLGMPNGRAVPEHLVNEYITDRNEVVEIMDVMAHILRVCKKYDIRLDILEGTPSHDNRQNMTWLLVNELTGIGADVHYIDTLCIRYIEKFGIDVLYVPDEWPSGIDGTWLEVQGLLAERNLDKVDFAVMHGAFTYQLPEIVAAKGGCHDPERYLSIVRHYIFINHVHIHTVYDRILASGSFDRLCHGEEMDKGHLRVKVRKDGHNEIVFKVNENAMIYRTLDCTGLTGTEIFAMLDNLMREGLKPGSYLRLKTDKHDPAIQLLKQIKQDYPAWVFSTLVNKEKVSKGTLFTDNRNRYEEVTITPDNLKLHLLPRIEARLGEGAQLVGVCGSVIDELL